MEKGGIKLTTIYQVIIWFDSKQLSEVPEGQWGIGFEPEVRVVVRRSQVAPLAVTRNMKKKKSICQYFIIFIIVISI